MFLFWLGKFLIAITIIIVARSKYQVLLNCGSRHIQYWEILTLKKQHDYRIE